MSRCAALSLEQAASSAGQLGEQLRSPRSIAGIGGRMLQTCNLLQAFRIFIEG